VTGIAPSQARASVAGFEPGTAGVTPPSDPARRGAFLTDVIVELGFADPETIQQLVWAAGQSEKTVEQSLLDSGALDEGQLSLAIAERNGLDHVDLEGFDVDAAAAEMLSRPVALRYGAVPIAFASDGALIVAVKDPFDSLGISDIEVMTKSEVRRVIAAPGAIARLIERLPEEPPAQPAPLPAPEWLEAPAVVEADTEIEMPERALLEPPAAPQPQPAPSGELGDLAAELRVLQETARKADVLAVAVGRRVEELEGADERAQRLDRELAAAGERIAELERRLSVVLSAAEDVREATEKLGALHRALEQSAP
jgi:hypothetical protein